MENVLRFVIVFLWCVCFGFFSVMGYLDDTMVTSPILAGLMAALVVYCAIEWSTKKRVQSIYVGRQVPIRKRLHAHISHGVQAGLSLCAYVARIIREFLLACVQLLHRTRVYLTVSQSPHVGQHQEAFPDDEQALGFFQKPALSVAQRSRRGT